MILKSSNTICEKSLNPTVTWDDFVWEITRNEYKKIPMNAYLLMSKTYSPVMYWLPFSLFQNHTPAQYGRPPLIKLGRVLHHVLMMVLLKYGRNILQIIKKVCGSIQGGLKPHDNIDWGLIWGNKKEFGCHKKRNYHYYLEQIMKKPLIQWLGKQLCYL